MISFKPIELADKATIEQYTLKSECRNCDMSFANIYCWRHHHQSSWAIVEGFLVIRFLIDGQQKLGYMQPIGEGDFCPILPLLAEDAHRNGQRLRLFGLCREGRGYITGNGCRDFAFDDDRSLSDYIYRAEDLRTLSGRKYQPKRNHLNRFFGNYTWRYETLERRHFEECIALEAEWRAARAGQEDSAPMLHEQQAILEAFAHYKELQLHGGVLYVENRLAAFTYGSAINYDTFDCHVEKADTRYEGIFAAINKLFADHLPAQYTYINREEDMGLEGLRRSKLSYHPALLWPKSTAIHLHADERACKALWQEVFGDDDAFVDAFLMRYYKRRHLLAVWEEERMISMVHRIPFRSELGLTGYLYGVATAPDRRGRGWAGNLLREAITRAREEGCDALVLIPSEESLKEFYGRLGFAEERPIHFELPDDFDFGSGNPAGDHALILPLKDPLSIPDTLHCHYEER